LLAKTVIDDAPVVAAKRGDASNATTTLNDIAEEMTDAERPTDIDT
jgi:hypothetical protein